MGNAHGFIFSACLHFLMMLFRLASSGSLSFLTFQEHVCPLPPNILGACTYARARMFLQPYYGNGETPNFIKRNPATILIGGFSNSMLVFVRLCRTSLLGTTSGGRGFSFSLRFLRFLTLCRIFLVLALRIPIFNCFRFIFHFLLLWCFAPLLLLLSLSVT